MEKYCFIIQPFDGGKYDKRYKEIIEPTVKECGLRSYRVDEDSSSVILIESIHEKIKLSSMCIAEITTDNPNVWYELGFALAINKPVIMLCSEERKTQFPFDIRHRNILLYKTETIGDFEKLRNNLKSRINALLLIQNTDSNEKLNNLEMMVLKVIWNNQNTPYELTSKDTIIKCNVDKDSIINAIHKLIKRRFIEYVYNNENGLVKMFYRVTDIGENWIQKNECLLYE